MSGLVALFFGGFIIVFFAYDRFNRAGYEGSRQFERLVAYLSPDKLRARQVILRAYLFYATTLLIIYLFLCIYAEVLPQLGIDLSQSGAGVGATEIGAAEPSAAAPAAAEARRLISPSVALGVALVMVGMAPSFPILERFECWLRTTAQRLAGIPTRVIEIAESLRSSHLSFGGWDWSRVPSSTLLIPAGDWQRMIEYDRAARDNLSAPDEFRDNLKIVFAVAAWVLDGKLKLSGIRNRLRFQPLEQALLDRFHVLVASLDERASAPASPAAPAPPSLRKEGSWDRVAHEVDDLADDFCFLLALYLEHGIISSHPAQAPASSRADGSAAPASAHQQQQLAQERLDAFLGHGCNKLMRPSPRSYMLAAWLWTIGVVVAVSIAWSLFPGGFEAELQGGIRLDLFQRVIGYTFFGFGTICVPMLVLLALRDGGLQTQHWVNMSAVHWTRALPQAVGAIVVSSAAATLMLLAAWMWELSITRGNFDIGTAMSSLQFQLFYRGPATLKGAILALIVASLLDAHHAQKAPPRRRTWPASLGWAVLAALIMALWGGITRTMASLASMAQYGRESLDAIDGGLIFYAVVHAAITGFLVVFCIAEYVFNEHLPARDVRANRPSLPSPPVAGE